MPRARSSQRSRSLGNSARQRLGWLKGRPYRGGAEAWRDRAVLLPLEAGVLGLRTDQAKQLKDLEKENARLKWLLADAEP